MLAEKETVDHPFTEQQRAEFETEELAKLKKMQRKYKGQMLMSKWRESGVPPWQKYA